MPPRHRWNPLLRAHSARETGSGSVFASGPGQPGSRGLGVASSCLAIGGEDSTASSLGTRSSGVARTGSTRLPPERCEPLDRRLNAGHGHGGEWFISEGLLQEPDRTAGVGPSSLELGHVRTVADLPVWSSGVSTLPRSLASCDAAVADIDANAPQLATHRDSGASRTSPRLWCTRATHTAGTAAQRTAALVRCRRVLREWILCARGPREPSDDEVRRHQRCS